MLHRQQFVLPDGHPLACGYDVVGCATCGDVYADTDVPQATFDRYYAEMSKYENQQLSSGSGRSDADARRLAETADCLANHLSSKASRILDIGCAGGGLLKSLRDRGFTNLHGVDPSPRCAAEAAALASAHTLVGSLSALPPELGLFDCIVLSHVLEHLWDVDSALKAIRGMLAETGLVYIEVPDANRYADFYVSPFHYFDTEHINHFSLRTLRAAMTRRCWSVNAEGLKLAPLTNLVTYPAVWLIAKKANGSSSPVYDQELLDSVQRYISRSAAESVFPEIDSLVAAGAPVIVWGVGASTTRLLANASLNRANIVAFVDNDPKVWGGQILGRPVLRPMDLAHRSETIVITSKLYGQQIAEQIRKDLGLGNRIVTVYPASERNTTE